MRVAAMLAFAVVSWLPAQDPAAVLCDPPPTAKFGDQGSWRWLVIPMVGYTREDRQIMTVLDAEVDYFIVQNVSINVGIQEYYFAQRGPDAFAVGPALTARWHFVNREHHSLFVAVGCGAINSTRPIPEDGAYWNLTPRIALGFTREIDSVRHTRVTGGIRYNHLVPLDHVRGPERTTLQFFAGVSVPFR